MNPSLWLHLAECCIAACKQSFSHEVKHLYGKSHSSSSDQATNSPTKTVIGTIGSGIHRKFVLKPTSTKLSVSATNPSISLEYAALCLRNALTLCGHPVTYYDMFIKVSL
jgi:CCR4-NOT transcription complex subunit 10